MKKFAFPIVLGVALLGSFGFGFSLRDLVAGRSPSGSSAAGLFGLKSEETPAELYRQHLEVIHSRHHRKLELTDLRYAAMDGLVASLGDPHTNFFEPEVAESFTLESRGNFVGVGARLGDDPLGAKVAAVFDEGPASKAGLKVNDVIVAVDGVKVAGVPVTDIVSKIRGEKGTSVRLGVMRAGQSQTIVLSMKRDEVQIPSAEGKMLDGGIGYISVTGFNATTTGQFSQALDSIIRQDAKGLVIDLRQNGGGFLETASDMLSLFIENKPVVKMRFRGGNEREERTAIRSVVDYPKKIVVLVDEQSASASEIFAGVMRDYKLATIVGEHTYGKTSVQNVHLIPFDKSSIKVTVAKYFLPSGTNFDRKVDADGTYISGGLLPDVTIENPVGQQVVIGKPEQDPQLKKAVEVIKGQSGSK